MTSFQIFEKFSQKLMEKVKVKQEKEKMKDWRRSEFWLLFNSFAMPFLIANSLFLSSVMVVWGG